jgi:hypothetical protein
MSFGKGRVKPLVARELSPIVEGSEKRSSSRRDAKMPGLIFPGGVAASIPCVVLDHSMTGARLQMQAGWVNPFRGQSSLGQTFTLVMRIDRMEVDCEIVRIEENELGVRYVSVLRPIARKN